MEMIRPATGDGITWFERVGFTRRVWRLFGLPVWRRDFGYYPLSMHELIQRI
jgi:hypothetical protein